MDTSCTSDEILSKKHWDSYAKFLCAKIAKTIYIICRDVDILDSHYHQFWCNHMTFTSLHTCTFSVILTIFVIFIVA
jgi:hypothetical protein